MAGTVPQITAGTINGVTGLTDRPVYFLRVNGSPTPNLVVKGDAASGAHEEMTDQDAEVSIKWGSKLMKNVNNELVNTKLMTPAEVAVFKAAAVLAFPNGSKPYLNVAPGGPAYTWVKMPMVPGLSDAEFFKKNPNGPGGRYVAKDIKSNIVKFSDDAVWTDLGKVVAVDIFNGNSDRFDINDGAWVNKGNIMFLEGGLTRVIGLDTFDPHGGQKANLHTGASFPELRTLIDEGRRNEFALACATSVGAEMKRALLNSRTGDGNAYITVRADGPGEEAIRRIDLATMDQLFVPYAPAFAQGIAAGADQLRTYLQSKVRQYAPPPAPVVAPGPWQRAAVTPAAAAAALAMGRRMAVPAAMAVPAPAAPPAAAAAVPHGPPPLPPIPVKTIPPGILARMAYLHW